MHLDFQFDGLRFVRGRFGFVGWAWRTVFVMALILAGASAQANETYYWTGGEPGFSGEITLDSSFSPTGGGTIGDIVFAEATIPEPGGQAVFYYDPRTFGLFSYQAFFQLQGPFSWNSQQITAMTIYWVPFAPVFDNLHLGPSLLNDYNANGFGLLGNYQDPITDNNGSWLAADASVPDGGSTVFLLALAMGALGCCRRWPGRL